MKNLWHHSYTKMTSLYYYMARKFEISPTFLIYFEWNLMGILVSMLVLRLLKKKCFYFSKKGINTACNLACNEPHVIVTAMEF